MAMGYVASQNVDLNYYLPEIEYNDAITTPKEFLGFQIGDQHVGHDQVVYYMRLLAEQSDRIIYEEYARSHENRPLILLTISSPDNQKRMDQIKEEHQELCNPEANDPDIENMPAVIYQGFSVHGNEPSGTNAAMMVAYYLAAGQGNEINDLLDKVVILFDPSFNPDGLNRFASWANTHKSKNINPDPNDREYGEAWPRGRTNHYWFDLNRDWIFLTHPESQGRMKKFHEWKPNILTDHHEMGTNSTFFFQPGIPTRVHPLTPIGNQELTQDIADFHIETLDEIGSLYFSREGYDDYYYGKGSAFPDINGGIGILFEQASSRGHAQESDNGILTFPFTIRNQVKTALSTQKAAVNLRTKLLEHQRKFYANAPERAKADPIKAYVFSRGNDEAKALRFIEILKSHGVKTYELARDINGFTSEESYIVPLNQKEYSIAKTIFDKVTTFEDSLFYDVSTWNMPLSFDLDYDALSQNDFKNNLLGALINDVPPLGGIVSGGVSDYAYLFNWDEYFAPKLLNRILSEDLRAKVLHTPIKIRTGNEIKAFDRGAIMIPVQNQTMSKEEIFEFLQDAVKGTNVTIVNVATGAATDGYNLGSRTVDIVNRPAVMMFVGDGVNSNDAGEIWHLLDTRYDILLTKMEMEKVRGDNLDRYNVIIMPDGNYRGLGKNGTDALKEWVSNGGTLICYLRAIEWARMNELVKLEPKESTKESNDPLPYDMMSPNRGRNLIGGAIFQTKMDLTNPISYGLNDELLASFKQGTQFYKLTDNPYSMPGLYTESPLLSGYVTPENEALIAGSPSVIIGGRGRGKVICFVDNTNFRGYTYGANKLLANAIFFGSTISSGSVSR